MIHPVQQRGHRKALLRMSEAGSIHDLPPVVADGVRHRFVATTGSGSAWLLEETSVIVILQRDLGAARTSLQLWLSIALPRAKEIEIIDLWSPANGLSGETLLFEARWIEGGSAFDRRYAVRIAPTVHHTYLDTRFTEQYRLLQVLAERSDIPVPSSSWYESNPDILGAPFYVTDYIDGVTAPDVPSHHVHGWVTELSPGERTRMCRDTLELTARLHRLDAWPQVV
ncbi:phosphotransferase, partial [Umezawaea endophytica]